MKPEQREQMKEQMNKILRAAYAVGASDIHITAHRPPMMRQRGHMGPIEKFPVLTEEHCKFLIYGIISEEQEKEFEERMELDCAHFIEGLCRFRVNVLMSKKRVEAVLRIIPSKIPDPDEIGLSPSIKRFAELPRGLVLVTGPTGSGKSTTLAALMELINKTRKEHIITIEDPVEFIYEPKECVIRQREVGTDTHSFLNALKAILRQDPDIILVGEMRDLETISLGLTAAETGHLVFATLHTQDAPQTIDRVIDVFPPHQQQQIRVQLSACLEGVVSQQLLPRLDGKGRAAAREVMVVTPAIANLIREGKTHQIYSAIETGGKFGMVSMDQALTDLVKKRIVSPELAVSKSHNPDQLRQKLGLAAAPTLSTKSPAPTQSGQSAPRPAPQPGTGGQRQ